MARLTCPSCGEPYNGKRCRACLYEQFTEEITHGNHTHEGEPLVIDAPVRKPVRRKDPFGCEKKTKKKTRGRYGAIIAVVLALAGPVLDIAAEVISDTAESFSYATAEPEPIAIPEDAMVLYADDDLRILADWKNGQEYADGVRIFVENDTGYDLTVTAEDIIVDGCMMDTSYFYCDSTDGTVSCGTLRLNGDALEDAGISTVGAISFYLDAWEQETYDPITTSERVVLQAGQAGTGTRILPEGRLIYEQDGIRVSFLGYREDEYYPGEVYEGTLLFHIENDTERYLEVYSAETLLGGEAVDTALWCQLYPGTRAVSTMYLYALEDMGFASPDDLFPAQVALEITDRDDYDFFTATGRLELDRE